MAGQRDLEELQAALRGSGPSAMRQPAAHLAAASCLVVAKMLVDADHLQYVVTGRHPASGVTDGRPAAERFADQVRDLHRRLGGGPTPPWTAATQMSWTSHSGRDPVRHAWHAARWRRSALFDRVALALHDDRPVVMYVGDQWAPRHAVLAVAHDDVGLHCYEPQAGRVAVLTRESFVGRRLDVAGWTTPWFVVIPTGRRASE